MSQHGRVQTITTEHDQETTRESSTLTQAYVHVRNSLPSRSPIITEIDDQITTSPASNSTEEPSHEHASLEEVGAQFAKEEKEPPAYKTELDIKS